MIKDGYTKYKELKADPKYKDIPVIVASNLGLKEDKEKAMQLGANDFKVKTNLSISDLPKKVKNILSV